MSFVAGSARHPRTLGAICSMQKLVPIVGQRRPAPFRAPRPALQRKSLHATCCAGNAHAACNHSSGKFTISTPLYYVNAAPHMGSAYPTIAADVLARYHRLRGKSVRFITGTDEHGEKIALAAAKRGLTPQQHCDSVVEEYKALWQQVNCMCTIFACVPLFRSCHRQLPKQCHAYCLWLRAPRHALFLE